MFAFPVPEFGLACHVGVLLDLVTVGVAKSPYLSSHLDITDTSLKEMVSRDSKSCKEA